MELKGKKVLVVGLARSGVAAARLLVLHGAMVMANDLKPEAELAAAAAELRKLGVMLSMGSHPESLFQNADLIVVSPGVPADIAPLESARRKGVEIISEPELAGRFLQGRMIGITGSNGKTTTTTLTGELMRAVGASVIVGGNIGTPLTSLVEKTGESSWTVAELSSFQLETLQSLRVNVAVVTNITPDHLDRPLDEIMSAPSTGFSNPSEAIGLCSTQISGNCRYGCCARGSIKRIHFTQGARSRDIRARGQHLHDAGNADRSEVEVIRSKRSLYRASHVENIMAALGATISRPAQAKAISRAQGCDKAFQGVEHRIEHVADVEA